MTDATRRRGAAPVGYLAELPEVEARAVLFLRLWCEGPDARAEVWNDFAAALGGEHGREALGAFEQLCAMTTTEGRRPLMRHGVGCRCIGADEAAFANLVAAAAEGEWEDAMLLATLLFRPGRSPVVADLARKVGLALQRMALRAAHGPSRPSGIETPRTLH